MLASHAFVAKKREQPFFAFVPLTLPHLALQVPDDALARYRGAFEETPYTGKMPAGTYTVRVVNGEAGLDDSRKVTILPGETTRLSL